MNKLILEYVWLDGYKTQNLRSKTKVHKWMPEAKIKPEFLPVWNFDGSSTNQATGMDSERILQPVRVYKNYDQHYFVFCEVLLPDGSPHPSNKRNAVAKMNHIANGSEYWWGFEQEFFMTVDYRPAGFPQAGFPPPQGFYYCGVGAGQVIGRNLSEAHMKKCLQMGIEITGTNAEVAIGQWEYQVFGTDTLKACDDLWMSRYMLYRMAEEYEFGIDLNPKPLQGDWNGSGCHTNFSNGEMRKSGGYEYFKELMAKLQSRHDIHIKNYGENNEQRLTGQHETESIDKFSWGVGNRGTSIRIPLSTRDNSWRGYVEDRRPASNCDPYLVVNNIINTVEAPNEN
jgi:glutamine synthetase